MQSRIGLADVWTAARERSRQAYGDLARHARYQLTTPQLCL
jgi:hypothetical protein